MVENKKDLAVSGLTLLTKNLSLSKGYTLIEIIVVLGLSAIIFGMTIASFDSFNEAKKLETETQKLVSAIEEVVKKTESSDLNGVMCNGVPNGCDDYQYILSFPSTKKYNLSFECICGSDTIYSTPNPLYEYAISNNSKVEYYSGVGATNTFTLKKRTPIANNCIIVRNTGTNKQQYIKFGYPGTIMNGIGSTCP